MIDSYVNIHFLKNFAYCNFNLFKGKFSAEPKMNFGNLKNSI